MERQSPVEARKILNKVNSMVHGGIGFIPVPFTSEEERIELVNLSIANLEKLATMAEAEENKQ